MLKQIFLPAHSEQKARFQRAASIHPMSSQRRSPFGIFARQQRVFSPRWF